MKFDDQQNVTEDYGILLKFKYRFTEFQFCGSSSAYIIEFYGEIRFVKDKIYIGPHISERYKYGPSYF